MVAMLAKQGLESATVPIIYQLLNRFLDEMHISKVCHDVFSWTCTNCEAGMMNVDPGRLGDQIKKKSDTSYEWRVGAEKWLLIYASGESIVSQGAPFPDFVDWQYEQLQAPCRDSSFERIFFWERCTRWTKSIK
jgi:hypothetical protein